MARTDTVGRMVAADPGLPVDHDVLVVGGGAAGLSAATFLARYGFDTLVLARGTSAIGQCAHLENYLGFPAGITPERFLTLGRTQVEHEGGTVREELVERVERVDLGDRQTDTNGETPDTGGFSVESDDGRTPIDGLYAAGWMTTDTVGCKSFPDFAGTGGEIPVNSYNRPYESVCVDGESTDGGSPVPLFILTHRLLNKIAAVATVIDSF